MYDKLYKQFIACLVLDLNINHSKGTMLIVERQNVSK